MKKSFLAFVFLISFSLFISNNFNKTFATSTSTCELECGGGGCDIEEVYVSNCIAVGGGTPPMSGCPDNCKTGCYGSTYCESIVTPEPRDTVAPPAATNTPVPPTATPGPTVTAGPTATPTPLPRPALCQSASINGTAISLASPLIITSTANKAVSKFGYLFSNRDYLKETIPQGIIYSGTTFFPFKTLVPSGTTNTLTVNYADFFKIDDNTGKPPTSIQVNAYFMESNTSPLSIPEVACVKQFFVKLPCKIATGTINEYNDWENYNKGNLNLVKPEDTPNFSLPGTTASCDNEVNIWDFEVWRRAWQTKQLALTPSPMPTATPTLTPTAAPSTTPTPTPTVMPTTAPTNTPAPPTPTINLTPIPTLTPVL